MSDVLPAPQRLGSGEPARQGRVMHKFLLDRLSMGADAALELVPEEDRDAMALIDLDALEVDPTGWIGEVAFAYDWVSGSARELSRGIGDRNYQGLAPTELPGTSDLVSLSPQPDGPVYIRDYKRDRKSVV